MIKQNTNFKKFIFYSFTLLLFIFILFQIKHISLAEDKTISKQNDKNIYIDNDLKQKHISYIYKKIDLDIDSINNDSILNDDLENIDIPINTENNTNILNDTQNISSSTNTTSSIKHEISDVYEYFASTFDEYIINPNGLKNDCPKTYEFMKNLIG